MVKIILKTIKAALALIIGSVFGYAEMLCIMVITSFCDVDLFYVNETAFFTMLLITISAWYYIVYNRILSK